MTSQSDLERQHLYKAKGDAAECGRGGVLVGIVVGVAFAILIVVAISLPLVLQNNSDPPTNHSATGVYAKAAVASDAKQCSDIGSQVLRDNGSAVDAAIASLLCVGVVNAHSAGLGGGFQMVVYASPRGQTKKKTTAIVAREVAPAAATKDMYNGASNAYGAKSVAVPGEILGYYEAWTRFGRLSWRRLFQPTIELCRKGFVVGSAMAAAFEEKLSLIRKSKTMREVFLKADQTPYQAGDVMFRPRLADTLDQLANYTGTVRELYSSSLLQQMQQDLHELGSIITMADLQNYRVKVTSSLNMPLHSGDVLYTVGPPASGAVLGFMLRVLEGFNLTPRDFRQVNTYQKMVEAFKFGAAEKTYLGDEKSNKSAEALANLTSTAFADYIRGRINLNHTENMTYYNSALTDPMLNSGTTHLSVLAPDGSAVAVTSSINAHMGSGVMGRRTHILFNNQMNDFWWPGRHTSKSNRTLPVIVANAIEPGKRPMSSMTPGIVVNSNGDVTMVIGAAGGTEIPDTVAYVAAQKFWLGRSLSEAVDELRLYHRLIPDWINYDPGFSQEILEELQKKGHKNKPLSGITVIQAITSACNRADENPSTCIEAISDWRKGGAPDGF